MKKQTANKIPSKQGISYCDWRGKPLKSKKIVDSSTILRNNKGTFTWKGIKTEAYKQAKGSWNRIIRRSLLDSGVNTKSHLRYFELKPGGRSSLEKHRHEHIVIGIRGEGQALLDKKHYKVNYLDVVYVSPNTPHQFLNPFEKPFGFLCIVSAKRDRPKILSRQTR
jgi:ribulose-bisphosphate carboxylase large chain